MRTSSFLLGSLVLLALAAGCSSEGGPNANGTTSRTLVLGAYTTPREAYGAAILPAFAAHRLATKNESVRFEESYLGSGAQARAIVGGFEADVAALSLVPDLEKLAQAGLVRSEPQIVSRSIVVIGVRPGNPKGIKGFEDLTRDDVNVLTPDVKMSGGAMWNIAALIAAARKSGADEQAFVASVLERVAVFDKGARESMLSFEHGAGDAIITYENEIVEAKAKGGSSGAAIEQVTPATTLLIENPAVVVDTYATKHGTQELATAFVEFQTGPEAQKAFAAHGYRPVDPSIALDPRTFGATGTVVTIAELGGWPKLQSEVFGEAALYDGALAAALARKNARRNPN